MIRIFISLFSTRHFILTIIVMFIAVSSYASKDSSVSSLPRIVGTEESDIFRVSMMLSLFEKRQMCLIQPRFGTSLMVFFNEDVQSILMEEISKECQNSLNHGMDECCSIAESMIDEIHQISVHESIAVPHVSGRHKGSLKRKLLRQIRLARRMAMIG